MSAEQEAAFSEKIRDLTDRGFGLPIKKQVCQKAGEFCLKVGLLTPFNGGPPEKPGIVALCNAIQNYLFDLTVVFGAATSRQPPDANNNNRTASAFRS